MIHLKCHDCRKQYRVDYRPASRPSSRAHHSQSHELRKRVPLSRWGNAAPLLAIVVAVVGCGDVASRPEGPPESPPGNRRVTLENYHRVITSDFVRSDARKILGKPHSSTFTDDTEESFAETVDTYRGVDGSVIVLRYALGVMEPYETEFIDANGFSSVLRNERLHP